MTRFRALLACFLLAASTPVRPAAAAPCDGVLCAGAATGDITPPVTTPMWGYTARQGLLYTAPGIEQHLGAAAERLGAGDPVGAAGESAAIAQEPVVQDKTSADTELYAKEFVANRGIHLRLQANAFVLRGANGVKVAVVQTDLGGVPGEVHQAVANRIAATGINRDHLLIGATHTHQGPGGIFQYQGYALLGGDEFDPRVFEAVVRGITDAIARADTRLAPARLGWKAVPLPGANRNRRVTPQWCQNPENQCDADSRPTPDSPPTTDRDAIVIRVDTVPGLPLGVIVNYAAHGTIGGDSNLLFSGDNQGWATRLVVDGIRREAGPLPEGHEIVDALVNGAQGDVSPVGSGFNDYSEMEDAGLRQAAPVLQAWRDLAGSLRSDVTVDARFEFLCFCGQEVSQEFVYDGPAIDKTDPAWNRVAPYAALGHGGVTADDGTSLPVPLPAQGHKAPVLAGDGLSPSIVRLQTLRIGDLLFAGVPGEPNTTAGRRISAALQVLPGAPWTRVAIAGLANDYVSYFATTEEYTVHQYEGSFTLFGPQSTPLLTQEYARLASAMIAGVPAPVCDPSIDVVDCLSHVEHPDTSATALEPVALDLGERPHRTGWAAGAFRLGTLEVSWLGGGPTAEWRPGADRVVIERLVGTNWERMAGDATDTATVLTYRRSESHHFWEARFDVPADIPTGSYRLVILGATWRTGEVRTPYRLESEFEVITSGALLVTASDAGGTWTIRSSYPFDPAASFRARPPVSGTATLYVERQGVPTLLTAPMTLGTATIPSQPGDILIFADVLDTYGNTGST